MKTRTLVATLALATLAAPAFAARDGFLFTSEEGGYSLAQQRYFDQDEDGPRGDRAFAAPQSASVPAAAVSSAAVDDGFHFVGGESGWEVSRHVFVARGGRLVHSDECDHTVHAAAATVTPADLDRAARFYPGA